MPDPRWDDLRFFLAGARQGSLSKAARALGVEQSTVSRRVQRLEDDLGLKLFERRPEGLVVTAGAEALLAEAEEVEAGVRRLTTLAAGLEVEVEGRVRVAVTEATATHLLFPALDALLRDHPRLRVEIRTGVGMADVLRREADIAMRNVRPRHPDMVARRVLDVHQGVFAHPRYLAGLGARPTTPSDLDWIAVAVPGASDFPEARWLAEHVEAPPRIVLTSFSAQIEAARRGLGAAVLSRALGRAAGLEELDLGLPAPAPFELLLVTHRALRRVPRVRVVMDWIVAQCGRVPA
jgi:DNA-binding transcriptional LysR family regulator